MLWYTLLTHAMRKQCTSISLKSAGTLSPTEMVTKSPGTKLRAKKSATWPSRILKKEKSQECHEYLVHLTHSDLYYSYMALITVTVTFHCELCKLNENSLEPFYQWQLGGTSFLMASTDLSERYSCKHRKQTVKNHKQNKGIECTKVHHFQLEIQDNIVEPVM